MLSTKAIVTVAALVSFIPLISAQSQDTSFQPLAISSIQDTQLLKSYALDDDSRVLVEIFLVNSQAAKFAKRDQTSCKQKTPKTDPTQNYTVIDMTPASCTSQVCYAGSFQAPRKVDCDAIVAAQKKSTGNLTAIPGTFVQVSSGTCAVVFQNPVASSTYAFQYAWTNLGIIAQALLTKCFQPEHQSIGGACVFDHYLQYQFENVLISLQRILKKA
ncbi:hypothetical protein O181_080528 [Austropuccinia psidii MF-1]|uniref:Uncharacterized protein n=1 Tax=Austropuccinia psidii MF-1 TaxID=1389203 RepID=A0A9Q3FIT5_9BASI|nr:hypothetical protein [Austropuccinia psidii MF-1]